MAQGLPARPPQAATATPRTGKASFNAWLKTALHKATDTPEYYWSVLFTWGHRAAILFLPIVGLSLALVYRARRDLFIYDHLLVAMNLLSFGFLLGAVGLLLPFSLMGWWFGLVAVWTAINLFQTLRGAYGSSRLGATAKALVVWTITATSALVVLAGLMVLALAEL